VKVEVAVSDLSSHLPRFRLSFNKQLQACVLSFTSSCSTITFFRSSRNCFHSVPNFSPSFLPLQFTLVAGIDFRVHSFLEHSWPLKDQQETIHRNKFARCSTRLFRSPSSPLWQRLRLSQDTTAEDTLQSDQMVEMVVPAQHRMAPLAAQVLALVPQVFQFCLRRALAV
jgi:hypothetical protein